MKRVISLMLAFIVGGGLALFGFRAFVLQPFSAPSTSMHPAIAEGDYFFVSKFAFVLREPRRGEIVTFTLADGRTQYVKRLVGLPGDHIQMKGGVLFINGEACTRVPEVVDDGLRVEGGTFFRESLPGGASHVVMETTDSGLADDTPDYAVPDGHYFMMGDNRDNSQDSRFQDPVDTFRAMH